MLSATQCFENLETFDMVLYDNEENPSDTGLKTPKE